MRSTRSILVLSDVMMQLSLRNVAIASRFGSKCVPAVRWNLTVLLRIYLVAWLSSLFATGKSVGRHIPFILILTLLLLDQNGRLVQASQTGYTGEDCDWSGEGFEGFHRCMTFIAYSPFKSSSCVQVYRDEPIQRGFEMWQVGPVGSPYISIDRILLVSMLPRSRGSWQPVFAIMNWTFCSVLLGQKQLICFRRSNFSFSYYIVFRCFAFTFPVVLRTLWHTLCFRLVYPRSLLGMLYLYTAVSSTSKTYWDVCNNV